MENLFKNTSGNVVGVQPNPIFLSTLENSGYNSYTAIADIIDNSIDAEAKNIRVEIKPTKILIIDDGNGMDISILSEAFKLGAITGKDAEFDLGNYGTGMKSASLALGNRLIVRTKKKNEEFLIGVFDKNQIIKNGTWTIPVDTGSDEEYDNFKKFLDKDQGTIIEITNLKEKKIPQNITIFRDTLVKKLGLYYKYIIEEKNINIHVNNKKVIPIDPMYRNETWSEKLNGDDSYFQFKDKKYTFNCFYLESQSQQESEKLEINIPNAGIYIYRSYRLVGQGLKLGIINHHNSVNSFRCELFVDGTDDDLFNSTFMKIINEKDKNDIDQSFKDILGTKILPYFKTVKTRTENRRKANRDLQENTIRAIQRAEEEINKNKFINVKRKLNVVKEEKPKNERSVINKGKNAFSHRARGKWCEVNYVSDGEFIFFTRKNGVLVLNINKSHVFFDEFIDKSDSSTINTIIKLLASMGLAQEEAFANSGIDMENTIDEFMYTWSEQLRKMLLY